MLNASCNSRPAVAATQPVHQPLSTSPTPGIAVSALTETRLRGDWAALDSEAGRMLAKLRESQAPLVWHKHGTFFDHLHDVWVMLSAWQQPLAWTRLGLFHSAYSNSFVAMGVFDRNKDRSKLADLVGDEAESLVYKFCSIDRQTLENMVLAEGTIRSTGYEMVHIATGEPVSLSGLEATAMITETLADELEQRFGWQSDLEAGNVLAAWPGPFRPTLRLSRTSRLAAAIRASGLVAEESLPPIFDRCSAVLTPEDEKAAADAYVEAISASALPLEGGDSAASLAKSIAALRRAQHHNPHVGEPFLVEAQLLLQSGAWAEAEVSARRGVALLETLATSWDKRMSWQAWLNWGRCLGFQAQLQEWPTTHGGIESLGAVVPQQRMRALNAGRSMM